MAHKAHGAHRDTGLVGFIWLVVCEYILLKTMEMHMPTKQYQGSWPSSHPDTPQQMNSPTGRGTPTRLLYNATVTHGGSYQSQLL